MRRAFERVMDENLVGYLVGGLDDAASREVEARAQADPEVRGRLNRLRQLLEPLACDRDDPAPPPDLVARTLGRVAEHVCHAELPRAPAVTCDGVIAGRAWWRRADVLVAACLLLTALGLGLPALYRMRGQGSAAVMVACQNNLREFYSALTTYRDQHGSLPDLAKEAPRNVAGLVVPALADAGVLPQTFSVRCPAVGPHLGCQVTLTSLRALAPDEFDVQAPALSLGYAYSLGYRDETGSYFAPGKGVVTASAWPIMADRPPSEGIPGNSINHAGTGQNLLFLDGHVRFQTARSLAGAGDDIFLNRDHRVAAGLGAHDVVLGFSAARP